MSWSARRFAIHLSPRRQRLFEQVGREVRYRAVVAVEVSALPIFALLPGLEIGEGVERGCPVGVLLREPDLVPRENLLGVDGAQQAASWLVKMS
jgi:hypothetical protein